MKMIFFWTFCVLFIGNSAAFWSCDFDYQTACLPGLLTGSIILLNETDDRPRLPASDVTAIQTDNDQGSCSLPYPFSSFDMYFCAQTSAGSPATCPTFNETGSFLNCSEGEYGYVEFDAGATDNRTYRLDVDRGNSLGFHCLKFFYFFSDNVSQASIEVFQENSVTLENQTIGLVDSTSPFDRWNEARFTFDNTEPIPIIYFSFSRNNVVVDPFYIAVDEISIIDQPCEPITVPSTSTARPTTTSTVLEETSSPSPAVVALTSTTSTTTSTSVPNVSNTTMPMTTTTTSTPRASTLTTTTPVISTTSTTTRTIPPVQTDSTIGMEATTVETSSATSIFAVIPKDAITIFLLVLSLFIHF